MDVFQVVDDQAMGFECVEDCFWVDIVWESSKYILVHFGEVIGEEVCEVWDFIDEKRLICFDKLFVELGCFAGFETGNKGQAVFANSPRVWFAS